MMGYGSLPVTGATATVLGVTVDQLWILVLGVGLVFGGALITRMSFRRGKGMTEA